MKIVTVGYLHGSGGAEKQIILLSNEMAERGHEVHLIVLNANNAPFPISSKVEVHDLTSKEGVGRFRLLKRFFAMKSALSKICPEVTINYNIQSAYFSLLIGRKTCGKIIYSERGDPYDDEYSGLLGKVRDMTCKHIDAFVFQSEGSRNFFHLTSKQKSVIIHNSVTISQEKYPMPESRDNRIVSVGRLHPQKNPWLLIDAFSLIANKHTEVSLELYGDGQLKNELQAKIDGLGLTDRIHLNASRKDIFDCIRTARLFVLSSDFEGMPNALMEAMALGLPCIAADCRPGGARTLIEDGVNGFIVPVRNPNAMAEKIEFVLDNQEKAEELAIEARRLAVTHTNKVTFNKWNEFLSNL